MTKEQVHCIFFFSLEMRKTQNAELSTILQQLEASKN